MSNHYTVDLLTPSRVLAKGIPAKSLFVPTESGQINILENHTHVVTKLTTGQVTIFGGADDPDRFFTVTSGICKVLDDKIVILSKTSEEAHEIDAEKAKTSLDHAESKLSNESLTDEEIALYQERVEIAKLRIQMAK